MARSSPGSLRGRRLCCWTLLSLAHSLVLGAASPAHAQVVLPWLDDLEQLDAVDLTASSAALPGGPDWSYSPVGSGRLRTAAGPMFRRSGERAFTLDRDGSGDAATNFLVLTLDLSSYATDDIVLHLSVLSHGDEEHDNDAIWVRGAPTAEWVLLADLSDLAPDPGTWHDVRDLGVTGALGEVGQVIGDTFQLRIGQQDTDSATSFVGVDGYSFDDFAIEQRYADNVAVVDVLGPQTGDCGEAGAYASVRVRNEGSDPVEDVEVTVELALTSGTIGPFSAPPVSLPEGGIGDVEVGPFDLSGDSAVTVTATALLPGDQDPSDDELVVDRYLVPPQVPVAPAPGACPGHPVILEVLPEPGFSYQWFASAVGGEAIHAGDSYTTPPLATDTYEYYVERADEPEEIDAPDPSTGTWGSYADLAQGLVFDVSAPAGFTLDSFLVYPDSAGSLAVVVRDFHGDIVHSVDYWIAGDSPTLVEPDLFLPPGDGYTVTCEGSTLGGLFRHSAGATYPLSSPSGGVEIVDTSNGLGALGYYYFLYDWEVTSETCQEERTLLEVVASSDSCGPDAHVSIESATEVATAGHPILYEVTVENRGTLNASGSSLTVDLPWAPAGPDLVTGACAAFPCALPDLIPGAVASTQVTVTLPSDHDPTSATTTASVSTPDDTFPLNDEFELSLPVQLASDLEIAFAAPTEVVAGGDVYVDLVLVNTGPSDAEVVVVLDDVEGLLLGPMVGCDEEPPEPCVLTVAASTTRALEIPAAVPVGESGFARIMALATGVDPNPTSASADWEALIVHRADLALSEDSSEPAIAEPGSLIHQVVGVTNHGPSVAMGILVTFALDGVSAVEVPESCAETFPVCDPGLIELNGARQLSLVTKVDSGRRDPVTVHVVVDSLVDDPVEGNNECTFETEVELRPELELTATQSASSGRPGEWVELVFTLRNNGAFPAEDVELEVELEDGLRWTESTLCAQEEPGVITCRPGDLAAGAVREKRLAVGVDQDASEGSLRITAQATSSGNEQDPSNQSVELLFLVLPFPDVDPPDPAGCGVACAVSIAGRPGGGSLGGLLLVVAWRSRRRRGRAGRRSDGACPAASGRGTLEPGIEGRGPASRKDRT